MKIELVGFDTEAWEDELYLHGLQVAQKLCPPSASRASLLVNARIDMTFVLRLFLGVPQSEITAERYRFAQAFMGLMNAGAVEDQEPLLSTEDGFFPWQRKNPARHRGSLDDAVLDLEFLRSFGLPDRVWSDALGSESLLARFKAGSDWKHDPTPGEAHRAYVALAIFGFPDPLEFFRARGG